MQWLDYGMLQLIRKFICCKEVLIIKRSIGAVGKKERKKNGLFRNSSHTKHLTIGFSKSKIIDLKLKCGSRN
jgi:hypothetical protein